MTRQDKKSDEDLNAAGRAYVEQVEASDRTFDGRVAELERVCRRLLPSAGVEPDFQSQAWFAREILQEIEEVRRCLGCGDVQRAVSSAVVVGALSWEAGPEVRRWLAYRGKQQKRAHLGRETQRDRMARNDDTLLEAVRRIEKERGTTSPTKIARILRAEHGKSTDRHSLDKVRKRILRAKARRES